MGRNWTFPASFVYVSETFADRMGMSWLSIWCFQASQDSATKTPEKVPSQGEESDDESVALNPPRKRRCLPAIIHDTDSDDNNETEEDADSKKNDKVENQTPKQMQQEDSKENIKFIIHRVVKDVIVISSDEEN